MKTYILPIIVFLFSLSVTAQPDHSKIQALKVSHITEQLDLTEKEAQEFWPVYNEYDKKISTYKYQEMRKIRREIKDNVDSLTNEEALELINRLNTVESNIYKAHIELSEKLSHILPPKKIIILKISEENFKRKLLDRFKKHRGGSGQGKRN